MHFVIDPFAQDVTVYELLRDIERDLADAIIPRNPYLDIVASRLAREVP